MKANNIIKAKYSIKLLAPSTIFNAPKFVIFVAGPVIINAVAEPILRYKGLGTEICSPGHFGFAASERVPYG